MQEQNCQSSQVLAMYDVRGIQKYIFKTAKVKDAIGASRIVEHILLDALKDSVQKVQRAEHLVVELEWCTSTEPLQYTKQQKDISILFVGGGNAYVLFRDRALCIQINRWMSKYILEHTYSLQLAVAIVEKSNNYASDYSKVHQEMIQTKANMSMMKPLGTLPVMQMEIKTGYPMISSEGSTETVLKQKETKKSQKIEKEEQIFDNYVTKKGQDSQLAIVHIDGNNMGIRIRQLVEGISDYEEAVNQMRTISYHIDSSYKKVFEQMQEFFTKEAVNLEIYQEKEKNFFVRKILVAGDDITYVCNAKLALATVEYFCREIATYTMNGKQDEDSLREYGFSVCAGVSYIGSHFPFFIGYEVAEACCDSAKSRAKEKTNMDGNRIGNFVDFHICKNIQAVDLKEMRKREYVTSHGEQLLIRPYYIATKTEGALGKLNKEPFAFEKWKNAVIYFQNEDNLPRNFAKKLRNTYSMGKQMVDTFWMFLESRNWTMPEENEDIMYFQNEKGTWIARWYDALELMEDYIDVDEIGGDNNVSDKNPTIK